MDHSDIYLYLIIAFSVIVSVVKKARKQAEKTEEMPESEGGDVFRKLLEEIQRAQGVPKPQSKPVVQPAAGNAASGSAKKKPFASIDTDRTVVVEKGYVVPENSHHQHMSAPLEIIQEPEPVDSVLQSINLQEKDELKKAVIYSEIFRTKF